MGVAANGRCFPTAEDAAAYACGASYPVAAAGVAPDGTALAVVVECSGTSGSVLNLTRDRNDAASTGTVAFAGPSCDELEWLTYYPFSLSATDGALIGAAVAGVWLAGAAWRYVTRALHTGDSYRSDDE